MNILRPFIGMAATAFFAAATPGGAGAAMPAAPGPSNPASSLVVPVAGDCNSIAQQMAEQYGGRAKATVENRGGKNVCVIVIVVDGKNNERGQRIQKVVPLD